MGNLLKSSWLKEQQQRSIQGPDSGFTQPRSRSFGGTTSQTAAPSSVNQLVSARKLHGLPLRLRASASRLVLQSVALLPLFVAAELGCAVFNGLIDCHCPSLSTLLQPYWCFQIEVHIVRTSGRTKSIKQQMPSSDVSTPMIAFLHSADDSVRTTVCWKDWQLPPSPSAKAAFKPAAFVFYMLTAHVCVTAAWTSSWQ